MHFLHVLEIPQIIVEIFNSTEFFKCTVCDGSAVGEAVLLVVVTLNLTCHVIGFMFFPSVLLQDEEINQQSQLVENLKEQMLNLEEVTH